MRCGDLQSDSVARELLAFALRGVVKEWRAGVPRLSFGTFRRPK